MTSLIRPTSPLSAIELLGQQLAGPGLQQGLWSGSVSITLCQTGSDPEGEDRGLKRLERHEVKRVKPFQEKDVYRVCSGADDHGSNFDDREAEEVAAVAVWVGEWEGHQGR